MEIPAMLRSLAMVRQRLDVLEFDLVGKLMSETDAAESMLVESLEISHRQAARLVGRTRLLALETPAVEVLVSAFRSGAVGVGHLDAFAAAVEALEPELRSGFLDDTTAVVAAPALSARRFSDRLRLVAERLRRRHGLDLLSRQKRQSRLRTWCDRATGMWHLSGRFDPETAASISARLDAVMSELIAAGPVDGGPTEWSERLDHLRAQAFARLVTGEARSAAGKAELLVVIDTTRRNEFGEPIVDWGLPLELPLDALIRFFEGQPSVSVVDIASNGRLIDRSDRLDLGRSTRLANRAQRRMLRAWHATCAVPGCAVPFRRCEIHHVLWWRHGGTTDLANLAPVCTWHHHRIHDEGWVLVVDDQRHVEVRCPDGRVMTTGPPLSDRAQAA